MSNENLTTYADELQSRTNGAQIDRMIRESEACLALAQNEADLIRQWRYLQKLKDMKKRINGRG